MFRLPFLKEKMSDETVFAQIVLESISQLGYLMRVSNASVQSALADTIISIYCNPPAKIEHLEVVADKMIFATRADRA